MRIKGLCDEINATIKREEETGFLSLFFLSLPCEDTESRWLVANEKRVLTRHRIYWHLDLGFPNLWDCEE